MSAEPMERVYVRITLDDWRGPSGRSVYSTAEGVWLSLGGLHSGSTFSAILELDTEDAADLREALGRGFRPVFWCTAKVAP